MLILLAIHMTLALQWRLATRTLVWLTAVYKCYRTLDLNISHNWQQDKFFLNTLLEQSLCYKGLIDGSMCLSRYMVIRLYSSVS